MTNQERAEKILEKSKFVGRGITEKEFTAFVGAKFHTATREAYTSGMSKGCEANKDIDELNGYNKGLESGLKLGFAAACEQAARIADRYHLQNYSGNDGIESPARKVISGMQEYQKGLEDNCKRWAAKLERVYKAADALAEKSKDRKLRQNYWDEKARG